MTGTRRQQIVAMLAERERSFEELRRELAVPVRLLDEDLRHVERSLRRAKRRLIVTPPRCEACGFVFRRRNARRYYTPGRCPRCRSERIVDARLRVEGASSLAASLVSLAISSR